MSWNRVKQDKCAYSRDLLQSVTPLSYHLDPIKYYRCDACRPELGIVGGNDVSIVSDMVELENELYGINRPLTNCPEFKYTPVDSQSRYIKRCNPFKPTQPLTVVDTQLRHLKPCQFVNYQGVPLPPPVEISSCGSKK